MGKVIFNNMPNIKLAEYLADISVSPRASSAYSIILLSLRQDYLNVRG